MTVKQKFLDIDILLCTIIENVYVKIFPFVYTI